MEHCVTVLENEAAVGPGTGSLQLHFHKYYPKIGYTIDDVMKVMMNKNQRGFFEMCKCCSIVIDGILCILDLPENKDPIRITFNFNEEGGSGQLSFDKVSG